MPSPNHEFPKLLTPWAPTFTRVQQVQDTEKPTCPGTRHVELQNSPRQPHGRHCWGVRDRHHFHWVIQTGAYARHRGLKEKISLLSPGLQIPQPLGQGYRDCAETPQLTSPSHPQPPNNCLRATKSQAQGKKGADKDTRLQLQSIRTPEPRSFTRGSPPSRIGLRALQR